MEVSSYALLERIPIFDVLSHEQKEMLAQTAAVRSYRMGQTVVGKGARMNSLYFVMSGNARMVDEKPTGEAVSLGLLREGEYVGTEELLEEKESEYAIAAAGPLQLLEIHRSRFQELLSAHEELAAYFQRHLKSRAIQLFLLRATLFSHGDYKVLRVFLDNMNLHHVEKGQDVVREGEPGDAFYILHAGLCEVLRGENQVVVNRLHPGDFFGELALLTGEPRRATVHALEDVQLFRLSKTDFEQIIIGHPRIRKAMEAIASNYVSAEDAGLQNLMERDGELPDTASWVGADEARQASERKTRRLPLFRGMSKRKKYPVLLQQNEMDCGPTSITMILKYYGTSIPIKRVRDMTEMSRSGSTLHGLSETAETLGFDVNGYKTDWNTLREMPLPAIAHWKGYHFIVVYEVTDREVVVADPEFGLERMMKEDFIQDWTGALLTLRPTERLAQSEKTAGSIGRLLGYLSPHKRVLFDLLLLSVTLQLIMLSFPLFTQVIVDRVLVYRQENLLRILLTAMLFLAFFDILFLSARNYLAARTALHIDLAMVNDFYKRLLRLPLPYFLARTIGDITTRVNENQKIRQLLTKGAIDAVLDLLTIVVYGGLMLAYSLKLALIALCVVPLYVLLVRIVSPHMQKNSRRQFSAESDTQSTMVEAIKTISTVKVLAAEPTIQSKIMEKMGLSRRLHMKGLILRVTASSLGQFIKTLGYVMVLYFGARFVLDGEMSVGEMVAFLALYVVFLESVSFIIDMINELVEVRVSIERLDDVFQAAPEEKQPESARRLATVNGHIKFENVTFRYEKDGPNILQNIDLEILPGQTIALVGRSGSGKSTFANLLTKLFLPTHGTIRLDGHDLRQIHVQSLRKRIGVVQQENKVFRGSIRENISFQFPDANREDIEHAARLAGAHAFINAFPLDYDTQIGEGNLSLSGGQLQRISIARALLGQPRILIFDEATSALDAESERMIQENMDAMLKGRTTLIIAHRLSTIRKADRILVLDKGSLVESGSHNELMQAKGLYYYLISQQTE